MIIGVVALSVVIVIAIVCITTISGGTALPIIIGAIIGALIGAGTSIAFQSSLPGEIDWGQVVVAGGVGMIFGAFGGSAISELGMAIAGGSVGFGGSVASNLIAGENINWQNAFISAIVGAALGYISGGGAQYGNLGPRQAALSTRFDIQTNNTFGYYSPRGYKGAMASNGARIERVTQLLNSYALKQVIISSRYTMEISIYSQLLYD